MLTKKSISPAFVVPSLASCHTGYAELLAKQASLRDDQAKLSAERRTLEKAIAADTSRELPSSVAELLGDAPGTKALNRKRIGEINAGLRTIETALEILRQRIADARGLASRAVCTASKEEYEKRVAAVAKALEAVQAARNDYAALIDDFEANDVSWTSMGPLSLGFLGDRQDGHITRLLREVREAGYVN